MATQMLTHRIVLIGDSFTGKTALLQNLSQNKFNESYNPTVGASYFSRQFMVNNTPIMLQIWDTAGQEKFQSLGPIYYRNACGAIVVFDQTNRDSMEHISKWIAVYKENTVEDSVIIIAANKADLETEEKTAIREEAEVLAKTQGYKIFETSAMTGINVERMFQTMCNDIMEMNGKEVSTSIKEARPSQATNKAECC